MKTIEWASGLFEGEGCITYNGNRQSLHLGGKDLDVIQDFAAVMGVGNIIERKLQASRYTLYDIYVANLCCR